VCLWIEELSSSKILMAQTGRCDKNTIIFNLIIGFFNFTKRLYTSSFVYEDQMIITS